MELRHLRYFTVVAEEGHFTRAAVRLGMHQPPLSQQIRALEQELGFSLFHRHAKGADLTPSGVVFLKEVRQILHNLEEASLRAARTAHGLDGAIGIGLTSSAATHPFIPQLIRAYRAAWPQVTLNFREGNAAELTEAVATDKLDIAFLRLPVSEPPGMLFQPLQEEEMLLVLPRDHPALLSKGTRGTKLPLSPQSVSLLALRDDAFILVRRHGAPGMYAKLMEACEQLGFTPRIVLEVERMLTNISLVAAGVGVSAVPASMAGIQLNSVAYCRIGDQSVRLGAPLTMASKAAGLAPAVTNFRQLAESIADNAATAASTRRRVAGSRPPSGKTTA